MNKLPGNAAPESMLDEETIEALLDADAWPEIGRYGHLDHESLYKGLTSREDYDDFVEKLNQQEFEKKYPGVAYAKIKELASKYNELADALKVKANEPVGKVVYARAKFALFLNGENVVDPKKMMETVANELLDYFPPTKIEGVCRSLKWLHRYSNQYKTMQRVCEKYNVESSARCTKAIEDAKKIREIAQRDADRADWVWMGTALVAIIGLMVTNAYPIYL